MARKWANSSSSFGLTSKLFHWGMAALILGLFALGQYLVNAKLSIDQLYLYGWHKSAGVLAMVLLIARVFWTLRSHPPAPLGETAWQSAMARTGHLALYVLMLVVPVSGYIASAATGFEMSFWGLFPLPLFFEQNPALEDFFFSVHHFSTKALAVVIIVHVIAALYRQFGKKDGTLRRIWF